ncbi:MAG: nitrate- and nitrite sensing domain-containing protein [Halomonadaceae bacterium]
MSSAQQLLLTAIRCDIDNLTHLATTADIVGDISHFIHMLQRERGASTIYLVSQGQRFKTRRDTYRLHSQQAETLMRQRLQALSQEARPQAAARLLRRIAAVWNALDELGTLRQAIDTFSISPDAATQAFNQLTSGLLAIVFEAADTSSIDPDITRTLVAIFHLMQGKELAGQERACGAFGFTHGHFDEPHRALLNQLMTEQQRCFDTFVEFTTPEVQQAWQKELSPRTLSGICHLRDIACQRTTASQSPPRETPDTLGETWYELTTLRIDSMKTVEDALISQLSVLCHRKVSQAEDALGKAKADPCRPAATAPSEHVLSLNGTQPLGDLTANALTSPLGRSLIELTQAQASRLQGLSDELENTRKALRERKLIERAKGLIMAHQDMSEEEAYRFLRKTSMDQSKSMADMAQAILDLSAMLKHKGDGRSR